MLIRCRHCGARNQTTGRCVLCGRPLGSYPKAVKAAIDAAIVLALGWIALAWLTGLMLSILAILFGIAVSAWVLHRSHGRGLGYQAVATTATIGGIIAAQAGALYLLWLRIPELAGLGPRPEFISLMEALAVYDPATGFLYLLGALAGMFIWHHGDD